MAKYLGGPKEILSFSFYFGYIVMAVLQVSESCTLGVFCISEEL